MEEQLEGLRELLHKDDDEQLKEVYDMIDEKERKDREDLVRLKVEMKVINKILDDFEIPKMSSVLERVRYALSNTYSQGA